MLFVFRMNGFAFTCKHKCIMCCDLEICYLFQNRFYVQSKLKKELNEELRKLFREHTVDHHISHLLCEFLLLESGHSIE